MKTEWDAPSSQEEQIPKEESEEKQMENMDDTPMDTSEALELVCIFIIFVNFLLSRFFFSVGEATASYSSLQRGKQWTLNGYLEKEKCDYKLYMTGLPWILYKI